MTVRVDPDELRAAAQTISGGWTTPRSGSTSIGFIKAGSGIHGTDTSGALKDAGPAVAHALAVLKSRRDEFVHVLRVSADTYTDTDETAAARLEAIGDLNRASAK